VHLGANELNRFARHSILTIAFLALTWLGLGPSALGKISAVENANWKIYLVGTTTCSEGECIEGVAQDFAIVDMTTGEVGVFVLDNATTRVESLVLYSSKLVIFGDMGYSEIRDTGYTGHDGEIVTVVDLETGNILDELRSRDISSSPDGRYLAFSTYYRRTWKLEEQKEQKNIVLLYDLESDPSDSRVLGYEGSQLGAGVPLFPPESRAAMASGVPIANVPGGLREQISFIWDEESQWLAFIATDLDLHLRLVSVHLHDGFDPSQVCSRRLIDHVVDSTSRQDGRGQTQYFVLKTQLEPNDVISLEIYHQDAGTLFAKLPMGRSCP
jgi:hypothetical protein